MIPLECMAGDRVESVVGFDWIEWPDIVECAVICDVESDAVYFSPWRTASSMAAVAFSMLSRTGSISSRA